MIRKTLLVLSLAVCMLRAEHAETGVVLVMFRKDASAEDVASVERRHGLVLRQTIERFRVRSYSYADPVEPSEKSRAIRGEPPVQGANPNWVRSPKSADPGYPSQWYLKNGDTGYYQSGYQFGGFDIRWEAARDRFVERAKIKVAVVDSGVALSHADLAAVVIPKASELAGGMNGIDDDGNGLIDDIWGYDWYGEDAQPLDLNGHGTQIAGIIGATIGNGTGVSGITNAIELRSYRVFRHFASGRSPVAPPGTTFSMTIMSAVSAALDDGCRVINLSLSGQSYSQVEEDFFREALTAHDALMIVSAGNNGADNDTDAASYPASYDSDLIISVAAQDKVGRLADFSNYGRKSVDIAAPGVGIRTLDVTRKVVASYSFEAGFSGWTSTAVDDGTGYVPWVAYGGRLCDWDMRVNVGAPPNTASWLVSPTVDGRLARGLAFEADAADYVLNGGSLDVELSVDGVNWEAYHDVAGDEWSGGRLDLADADGSQFRIRLVRKMGVGPPSSAIRYRTFVFSEVDDLNVDAPAYTTVDGTSFSAAIVSGVAAMVWSAHPELTATQLRQALLQSARPVSFLTYLVASGGMVDADAAMRLADIFTGRSIFEVVQGPSGGIFSLGTDVNLRVRITPGATASYQWRRNGVPIAGATASELALGSMTEALSGLYEVVVTSPAGSVTRSTRIATPGSAPRIVIEPADMLVPLQSSFRLLAQVVGDGPIVYKWFRNGVEVNDGGFGDGAFSWGTSYVAGGEQFFFFEAQSPYGKVRSRNIRVVTQGFSKDLPASLVHASGKSSTLSVKASGLTTPQLQWRLNGVAIPGATNSTLTVRVPPGQENIYDVVATTPDGSIASKSCRVKSAEPIVLTTLPSPASALADSRVTLSAGVSSADGVTFQWFLNGKPIAGKTGPVCELPAAQSYDSGNYHVVASGPVNSVRTKSVRVTVLGFATLLPEKAGLLPGKPVKLTASATPISGLTYQWRKNGVNIPGANGKTLTVQQDVLGAAAGFYDVVVTSSFGSITSRSCEVMLQSELAFVGVPVVHTLYSGLPDGGVELSANVMGGALDYQWLRNGVEFGGATGTRLYIDNRSDFWKDAVLSVRVRNLLGTKVFEVATIRIVPAPVFTAHPQAVTKPSGSSLTISASVSATTPVTYRWMKDGAYIPFANSSSYTIRSLAVSDRGRYVLEVTSGPARYYSRSAYIWVTE